LYKLYVNLQCNGKYVLNTFVSATILVTQMIYLSGTKNSQETEPSLDSRGKWSTYFFNN
jgi:hypothetical protein